MEVHVRTGSKWNNNAVLRNTLDFINNDDTAARTLAPVL